MPSEIPVIVQRQLTLLITNVIHLVRRKDHPQEKEKHCTSFQNVTLENPLYIKKYDYTMAVMNSANFKLSDIRCFWSCRVTEISLYLHYLNWGTQWTECGLLVLVLTQVEFSIHYRNSQWIFSTSFLYIAIYRKRLQIPKFQKPAVDCSQKFSMSEINPTDLTRRQLGQNFPFFFVAG